MGGSAIKTMRKLEEAQGGILFLDEAYSLIQGPHDSFGQEALDSLLKAMEDQRASCALICAGYPAKMREFLDSNPGLQSCFNRFVYFDDYKSEELGEVFLQFCQQSSYRLDDSAFESLIAAFDRIKNAAGASFGNAREARTLLKNLLMRMPCVC